MEKRQKSVFKFTETDFSDPITVHHNPFNNRRARLIVALADPNVTQVDLHKMMEAGMNAVRLVAAHLTNEDKIKLLDIVNKAATYLAQKHGVTEWPCATCIDLKSCVVKTGLLEEERHFIILKDNSEVILTYDTADFDKCNKHKIFVDNPYLIADVTIGMEISIEQDEVVLQVQSIGTKTVTCKVIKEGKLKNMVVVCLRGSKRTCPYLTKKDMELIKLAMAYEVDMIFINYVRHVETVNKVKQFIGTNTRRPFIVSGICTLDGLNNLDDIMMQTDAILFSREMLAYELDKTMFYRMSCIQKWVTGKCRQAGKPMFMSGQILYNTFRNGAVDIKETSDIANALLEGVSGFVLRQCHDTDKMISIMTCLSELCNEIEPFTNDKRDFYRQLSEVNYPLNAAVATAISCAIIANQSQCRVIVIPTMSGRTVYYLNYMRPISVILAITTNIRTFRLLQVYRSVVPILYEGKPRHTWQKTIKARVDYAIAYAIHKSWIAYGDHYVTLEKGRDYSTYCDTVRLCIVEHVNTFVCKPDVI